MASLRCGPSPNGVLFREEAGVGGAGCLAWPLLFGFGCLQREEVGPEAPEEGQGPLLTAQKDPSLVLAAD